MSNIPAGTYTVRGVKGSEQYGRSQNGTIQVGVDLEIIGGELEGATMTTVLYFSQAAQEYSLARLRALGWSGDDVTNLVGIDANEAQARVKYETYEGKEQMRVEIVTGGGRMTFKTQMTEQEKRMFAASMKGAAAQSKPRQSAAAADNFPPSYGAPEGRPTF